MTADGLEALERALAASELGNLEVVRRQPCEYRTSFPVELLEIERLGPGRGTIVCKRANWDELDATAQLAKPRFLHDPEREACVYERLLPRGPIGPPRFFGGVLRDGGAWLFVEYVEGRLLHEVGERELWEQAAAWLGRFHAAFGGTQPGLAVRCPLVQRDADFYRCWMERAREFGRGEPSDRRAALDRLAECHGRLVEALLAMPPTLLHGEFYASNVLIAEGEGGVRVAPLDWELAGPGPGALDLAALVSGWPAADREAMRLAYEHALGEPLPARDLELARLQVAIQWLGWAPPEWQPPADQRRDWGAEAIEIAEKLEL
jgi:phosphotransferase family enzyme